MAQGSDDILFWATDDERERLEWENCSEAESGCGGFEFWLSGNGPSRRLSAPGMLSIVGQPVGEIKIFQKVIRE